MPDGFWPRWSATGHLVYAHTSGSLFSVPFDAARLEITGPPVPVQDGVGTNGSFEGRYDLSSSGTLAYIAASAGFGGSELSFALLDTDGGIEQLPLESTDHWDAEFSPDGRYLAYTRGGQVWIYDLDLGGNRQLTQVGTNHHNPRWSPDGSRVAFLSNRDSATGVWSQDASGATPSELALAGEGEGLNPSGWLWDGTILLSVEGGDISAVPADGGLVTPLFQADWVERAPAVSPDGRWIAYQSQESGSNELYVRSWPDLAGKTLISEGPDAQFVFSYPVWGLDSRALYYHQGNRIVEATLDTSDGLTVVDRRDINVPVGLFYLQDVHPDGRLLVLMSGEVSDDPSDAVARLIVVTNWFTALSERLSGGS